MRPLIVDAFPFHNELDLLECRLTEIYNAVDWFVIVEADVTHQDRPKPSYYSDHKERFAPFVDKIVHVWATDLPNVRDFPDPWAREHAQRDWIADGLKRIPNLAADSIILQSDVDEIPKALHARNVRPGRGLVSFGQRGHFWALDWEYPLIWFGTVAGTVESIHSLGSRPFGRMRDSRGTAPTPAGFEFAGWHLSWLGGPDTAMAKVGSFCHPEVEERIVSGLASNRFYVDGIHVDGQKMKPVDVDHTWPKWVLQGKAPASWYRPR